MSKELTAAKRYARALYEAASGKNAVNEATEDLQSVAEIVGKQQELASVLSHPNIGSSAKTGLLKNLFAGKISELVLNLLVLLAERKRSDLIPAVYEQFVKIANGELGRAEAVVYSAKPLTGQETAAVAAKFAGLTGKSIQVTSIVDPSLLGGVKVRIGDTIYDGSLSGKLERMEKALQGSQAL